LRGIGANFLEFSLPVVLDLMVRNMYLRAVARANCFACGFVVLAQQTSISEAGLAPGKSPGDTPPLR